MEVQCSLLGWELCHHEEGVEELRRSLLYTTFELETTLVAAKEEISRREHELINIKDLLSRTIKERDEAQARCQKLTLEKLMLQQQLQQQQQQQQQILEQQVAASNNEDESKGTDSSKHSASSDSHGNMISSPDSDPSLQALPEAAMQLIAEKPLPEKGKLLQAVMEAGPLLHTLLLAGPLPRWQHPPPQINSIEIPPVAISSPSQRLVHQDSGISFNGCFNNKSNAL
ncbi:hypothetical protein F2P56_016898 [Juglans regia]|uniref:Uncharacterized protein n=2 Tax=Juglans regia TaxID=51240 RepID=A0A834CX33_JUGRE|nr:uncharacterized protein LOC108999684 [Juglans regia]KAF5467028.1 hypothetical protein F2P56_016898 [Juglans regia]